MKSLDQDNPTSQNTFTEKEIWNQPKLWKNTFSRIRSEKEALMDFFERHGISPGSATNIVLTGAGSSAYIGEIAQYAFKKAGFTRTQAISTTDLVTHFSELIDPSTPLLLISFGRSGNSPESKATIDLANKLCEKVSHLIISCNSKGELAQMANAANYYTFILPPDAEDQSLAMTGSFSSMTLAASLIADLPKISDYEETIDKLADAGSSILSNDYKVLENIAAKRFDRIIFLGDGPLLGCARESHLKVQELTDGTVVGKFDSFLGFRHGPKAVLDKQSVLVYLLSNQEQVSRYQLDLVRQIAEQKLGMYTLAVGADGNLNTYVDDLIHLPGTLECPEQLLPIPYILAAQLIGFFKAKALQLDPDNPSKNGAISRVVEGVTIYH